MALFIISPTKMNLVLPVLFALHLRVSASDYLKWSYYPEMEHLGGSCYPRDSCEPARLEGQDHLWNNFSCECGSHCIRYGTCCANSPHAGKTLRVEYRGEVCQKLSTAFQQPVVAVSMCSYRWRGGSHIQDKCEEPADVAEDPMSVVPVTSLETHVTYKNYFCAMCNYDIRDVHLWDVELSFDEKESVPGLMNVTKDYLLKNIFYNDASRAWGIIANDGAIYKVKFKFKVPSSIQKYVKKCYSNMVNRCGRSFSNDLKLQSKCMAYYAPVKVQETNMRSGTKFRNIHCAICNGVNVTKFDYNICKLDSDTRKPIFSLAHLLDINRNDGDLVGKKSICGEREKWDPFFKKCRSLVCVLPGYVIQDGKCVQS